MTDYVSLRGFVATEIQLKHHENFKVASFRLECPESRFNRETQEWEETGINWYSVSAFRDLGSNVMCSLSKGDRVMVSGRLKVRQFTREDNSTGTTVEVLADAVGPDLLFGTASYVRTSQAKRGTGAANGEARSEEVRNGLSNGIGNTETGNESPAGNVDSSASSSTTLAFGSTTLVEDDADEDVTARLTA